MAQNLEITPPQNEENFGVNQLYSSDFYEIKSWSYHISKEKQDTHNDCMSLVFVKKGHLHFNLSKDRFEMRSGHVLFDKPDYQFRFLPALGACTIFNFSDDFYRRFLEDLNLKRTFFFSNPQLLSIKLLSTPETEYLHYQLLKKAFRTGKLEMDNLVLELLHQIVHLITDGSKGLKLDTILETKHLSTIEMAKDYLYKNFASDISLQEISGHCLVSPFHFSRIFKKFTAFSPHQYLQRIRLKHGALLLKNSVLPVSEIAYSSGFNSLEYFATAFRQLYNQSPSQYRGGKKMASGAGVWE